MTGGRPHAVTTGRRLPHQNSGSVKARTPGEVFLAFHFPDVPANRLTSPATDAATSCPGYKVSAVRECGRSADPGRRPSPPG